MKVIFRVFLIVLAGALGGCVTPGRPLSDTQQEPGFNFDALVSVPLCVVRPVVSGNGDWLPDQIGAAMAELGELLRRRFPAASVAVMESEHERSGTTPACRYQVTTAVLHDSEKKDVQIKRDIPISAQPDTGAESCSKEWSLNREIIVELTFVDVGTGRKVFSGKSSVVRKVYNVFPCKPSALDWVFGSPGYPERPAFSVMFRQALADLDHTLSDVLRASGR